VLLRYGAEATFKNREGKMAMELTSFPLVKELFTRDRGSIFSPIVQYHQGMAKTPLVKRVEELERETEREGEKDSGLDGESGTGSERLNLNVELNQIAP
jgi:hypothetical protein